MGILITMADPTLGVLDAVSDGGTYTVPATGQQFPRVQVLTVRDLLRGVRQEMPLTLVPPYIQASRLRIRTQDESLFDLEGSARPAPGASAGVPPGDPPACRDGRRDGCASEDGAQAKGSSVVDEDAREAAEDADEHCPRGRPASR